MYSRSPYRSATAFLMLTSIVSTVASASGGNEIKLTSDKNFAQAGDSINIKASLEPDKTGVAGFTIDLHYDPSSGSQGSSDADFESYMTKQGFPESYKPYLRMLHEQHPKWIFTAQKLGVDWNTALKEECVVGRNLVHSSALASWKSMEKGAYDFNGGYW